jgi:predicted nucleotidyltransferase component of viral defense system
MFARVLTPDLQQLWGRLGKLPAVRDAFILAGGTALAVHLGHRRSIDLDFFSDHAFRPEVLERALDPLGAVTIANEEGTLHARIGSCKVSFLHDPYPWIAEQIELEGLRLAGVPDIAAMKVIAISQRGTRKDFFDLFRILRDHQPEEIKGWSPTRSLNRNRSVSTAPPGPR